MEVAIRHLRSAVRQWLRAPMVAGIALASLGLGIGAATAIFALVDAVHLKPLPVANPAGLVQVCDRAGAGPGGTADSVYRPAVWEAFREAQAVFGDVAAAASERVRLSNGSESRFGQALYVSGTFFRLFGVPMAAGRQLLPADDVAGALPVAVIDHAFWRRELGGLEAVAGGHLIVDGRSVEIVGVTAPDFFGVEVGKRMQVYLPIAHSRAGVANGGDLPRAGSLRIFGRLRPGQSLSQAGEALRSWQPAWRAATALSGPALEDDLSAPLDAISAAHGVSPLRRDVATPLVLLMCGVGLVLAIACANLAALMSARFADRRVDLWMRRALGASTGDLVAGLMVEALVLSAAGAALGVALAVWLARILVPALMQPAFLAADPYLAIALDWRLLATGALLALATGVATGLPPALSASRATRVLRPATLGDAGRPAAASRQLMLALVAAQVALSLVLVSSAGVLVRSFLSLTLQPTGVDLDRVLLASLNGPVFDPEPSTTVGRLNALCERFARLPGVQAVSVSTVTPLSGMIVLSRLQVPGYAVRDRAAGATAVNRVTPSFFEAFGTPIVAGRRFEARDAAGRPDVAIVNRAFEQKYFGGQDAVGRVINVGGRDLQVIGVAATAKYMKLREATMPVVYRPLAQCITADPQPLRVAIRTTAPDKVRGPILAELQRFDPRLTVEFRTLYDEVASSVRRERTLAWSGGLVGVLALSMAALGLYGAFSNIVARRHSEIAIRLALGASRRSVHVLVLRTASAAVAAGCVAGGAGLVVSARFVESLAYDVRVLDPWTVVATLSVIVTVAGAATFIPIRRAGRIDPMLTLRSQ